MNKLSVCIITKNEAANIRACLDSVAFADEIVVIDSVSTDETVAICREYTEKILVTPYKGCGPQKKQALEMATSPWALILDADERLSKELQLEIQKTLQAPQHDAYSIPFQTFYCGKAIKFGDWVRERHIRLIRTDKNTIVPRIVHFGIKTSGTVGRLRHKIFHYSFQNLEKVLDKMNTYSSYGAEHNLQQGKHAGLATAIAHGCFAFIRGYILKLGFLDGAEGFMLAISNAEGSYYKYLKLRHLAKQALTKVSSS